MMKQFLATLAVLGLAVGTAQAQVTILENFDAMTTSGEANTFWVQSGSFSTVGLGTDGGANTTPNYANIDDAGFTLNVLHDFTGVVPTTDTFKLTFWYQNNPPLGTSDPVKMALIYNSGASQVTVTIPAVSQTAWTKLETAPVALTMGDNISVQLNGQSGVNAGTLKIDELAIEVAAIPLSLDVRPFEQFYLSGTQDITPNPGGGTGTFTQVTYDVGDDASIEATETVAPFVFSFDTSAFGTLIKETVPVRVEVTDSGSATFDVLVTYTVDNRGPGRVELVPLGDLETWAAETVPPGFNEFQRVGNDTIVKETGANAFDGNSMSIAFAAADFTNRYSVRSDTFGTSEWDDLIVQFAGRGGSCRMAYFVSDDGGTTWVNPLVLLAAGTAVYSEVIDATPDSTAGLAANAGLTGSPVEVSIATHMFNLETCYWDNISVTGIIHLAPPAAEGWNLFE